MVGAGPTGLTPAFELSKIKKYPITIIEPDNQVGGISKTINFNGNLIDIGGHYFFSKSQKVLNWWAQFPPIIDATNQIEIGSHTGTEFDYAHKHGAEFIVAFPEVASLAPDIAYDIENFDYDKALDQYTCPAGQNLTTNARWYKKKAEKPKHACPAYILPNAPSIKKDVWQRAPNTWTSSIPTRNACVKTCTNTESDRPL
jgi:monoamine oxidase